MSAAEKVNRFALDDKEFEVGLSRECTITTQQIGLMFQMVPQTVRLRARLANRTYWPDGGIFDLNLVESFSLLVVEECPALNRQKHTKCRTAHHHVDGDKPSFNKRDLVYVSISESTATLPHVLSAVRDQLGEEYIIVTSDGFEVKDSPGTQGFLFWKANARKFYAVPEVDTQTSRRQKKRQRLSDSSTTLETTSNVTDSDDQLHKCCKTILGCEACVNLWYSGPDALEKTCPRCRAKRGFCETMVVLGLDELVAGAKSILGDDVAED
ncbi:hypothetical protein EMCRGX_G012706 [Ephydatia muelleri]